uniref:Uncharacterized protein n=1 Tax=Mustela putorius furo TaxID=9669 RepID=M3YMP7_MUSPF
MIAKIPCGSPRIPPTRQKARRTTFKPQQLSGRRVLEKEQEEAGRGPHGKEMSPRPWQGIGLTLPEENGSARAVHRGPFPPGAQGSLRAATPPTPRATCTPRGGPERLGAGWPA